MAEPSVADKRIQDLKVEHELYFVYHASTNQIFYQGHNRKDAERECLEHKAYLLHLTRGLHGADSASAQLFYVLDGKLEQGNELALQGIALETLVGFWSKK